LLAGSVGGGGGCGNSTALIASDAVGAFMLFPNLPWGLGASWGCWQAVSGVVGVVVIPQLSSLLMLLVPSRRSQTFQPSSVWGDRSFGGVVALLAASGVVGVMGEVGFGV
jgi:hypothetical protein